MIKLTMPELESELNNCTGSEQFYSGKPLFLNFVFTEGIKLLADKVDAYWLIDLIFSHQIGRVRETPFQIWELSVKDKSAIIECREDTDGPIIDSQEIQYTDFPEGKIKLYFINKTLLLPREY